MSDSVIKISGYAEFEPLGTPPPLAPTGKARQYFDSGSNTIKVSLNGAAYDDLGGGGLSFPITGTGATVTSSTPLVDLSQTWNSGAVVFRAFESSITTTAANSTSTHIRIRGGASGTTDLFAIWRDGFIDAYATAITPVGQPVTMELGDYTAFGQGVGPGIQFFGRIDGGAPSNVFGGIGGYKENATSGNGAGYVAIYSRPAGGGNALEGLRVTSAQHVQLPSTSQLRWSTDVGLKRQGASYLVATDGSTGFATVAFSGTRNAAGGGSVWSSSFTDPTASNSVYIQNLRQDGSTITQGNLAVFDGGDNACYVQIGGNGFRGRTDTTFGWTASATDPTAALDTNINRGAAGVVRAGTSAANNSGAFAAAKGMFTTSGITSSNAVLNANDASFAGVSAVLFVGTDNATPSRFYSCSSAGADFDKRIILFRSRGTMASQSAVNDGDYLGGIQGQALTTGGNTTQPAGISFRAQGTVGSGTLGGKIVFSTNPDASGTQSDRLEIDNAGNVTVASSGKLGFNNTVVTGKTIDTTAGDSATINSLAGRFRKDTSGATFTLTNDKITSNSVILLTAANAAIDGTATGWTVSAGSGTATITFNAAPTSNFDMNFLVVN